MRNYDEYDFTSEQLDPLEELARTGFGVDILPWQKFRYKINSGTYRSKLKWSGTANSDIEDWYLDLGKSNHEALCSLSLALVCERNLATSSFVQFRLFSKDFFFHAGCFLDSVATLIYCINDDNSLTAKETVEGEKIPRRRYMDWGMLEKRNTQKEYEDYRGYLAKEVFTEIIRVRHSLTHSWQPPAKWSNGQLWWPLCMRKKRIFYWPHDQHENASLESECPDWEPIVTMIGKDSMELKGLLAAVYPLLEKDFEEFRVGKDFEVID